ncbi:RTA1-domain-containing protein [Violaceomyces palustris]|uniref:RTA1-domain-containing protein n=1 Tax=Violaceomyces palustris TaxID=1673888 RepID=A0ACD0NNT0_9BASI|nr:RTA1-domain-containing protein [Violaceomyces palustris]
MSSETGSSDALTFEGYCNKVDPNPESFCNVENTWYGYTPVMWIQVVFSVLFGVLILAHLVQYVRYFKTREHFITLAIVCACGEAAGWIARCFSSNNPFQRDPYLAQIICLILSPVFISAVNYVAFIRTIDIMGITWSRISRKAYVWIFVAGDLISLIIQAAGGGISATAETESETDLGKTLMIVGVSVQVLVTGPFLISFLDYNFRRIRSGKTRGVDPDSNSVHTLAPFNLAILISTIFILIRCLYRIVEMSQGWTGYLAVHEVYFAVLDGIMIFVAVAVFVVIHPGKYLPTHPGQEKGSGLPVHHSNTSSKIQIARTTDSSSEGEK